MLLEAKWFVKEQEPEGKVGQLVLMHMVKGTLAGNGNYEVLFPLGGELLSSIGTFRSNERSSR